MERSEWQGYFDVFDRFEDVAFVGTPMARCSLRPVAADGVNGADVLPAVEVPQWATELTLMNLGSDYSH